MSKPIRWMFALNIALLLIWGMCKMYNSHKSPDAMTPAMRQMAVAGEQKGVIRVSEVERDMGILDQLNKSHTISDSDIDWGVGLIQTSLSRTYGGAFARMTVLNEWRMAKQLTPLQHEKIFQTVKPLLHDRDNNVVSMAMQILKGLKDPRSVSCLLPLLDSPKAEVRKDAQQALAKLGYKQ